jgi:GSH-dependent disulfide-bond oxidoreductase
MAELSSAAKWTPPEKIEALYAAADGNVWASVNAPTAGARTERELPRGSAPFQYYSIATPNGQKPAILLEELGIDYDAHRIHIGGAFQDQFSSGFVEVNPNSKIPAAVDWDCNGARVNLFESVSIMIYLADKYGRFIPPTSKPALRAEVMNWLFWQVGGQGPMTGNFGHFMVYAPEEQVAARNYGVARYGMEVKRLFDVLNNHLRDRQYMVGNEYGIADMAIFPWANAVFLGGYKHSSGITANQFLSLETKYPHVVDWCARIRERPAVQRGLTVCPWSDKNGTKPWLAAVAETTA